MGEKTISFGDSNYGLQVGQNSGSISAQFHLPAERPETPPKPSSFIPFCRDSLFVERKAILDQIQQACSAPPSRAALVGLGGVGKSQLAIEYAYRVRDVLTQKGKEIWVFWLHAGTRARVEQGFKAIADAVKIRGRGQPKADILQLVYQWLCNEHNGQWLMVLDSADDVDVFYGAGRGGGQSATAGEERRALWTYLPQSSNGSIIITTRDKDLAFRLTGHHSNVIEVGPMDRACALELLRKKSGFQFDEAGGIELVEALENMPLAIGQAAAYIQQRAPRTSVKNYLQEFQKNERRQLSLLNHDSGDLRRDPHVSNSVITTWQISFEHIRSQRRSASDLLSLMSFFDCQGIQECLVQPIPQNDSHENEGHSDDGSICTGEPFSSAFEGDIVTLRNYCLISMNESGDTFKMHGLVQLSTRKWLEMQNEAENFKIQCIDRLIREFPAPSFSNWPVCRKIFPHIEQAIRYYPDDKESNPPKEYAIILYLGGRFAKDQGRYAIAERMCKKALATMKRIYGAEHNNTAHAMEALAEVYLFQRQWGDAEQLFTEALKMREAVLEPDHPDTITNMNNIASTYINQGRWDEAQSLLMRVIEKRKMIQGLDHPATLTSMNNLASIHSKQKRWQEAESLFVEVVEAEKRVLGPEHPNTLSSIHTLASIYNSLQRWHEAELLLIDVVERGKRVLGLEHPKTLSSMHDLAFTYEGQERLQEAELMLTQVIEGRKRGLGPEHPDTLCSMNNLAALYNRQTRWQEAELVLVELVEKEKRVLGPEHFGTITSRGHLAVAYNGQKRWQEAGLLLVEVVERRRRVLGSEHSATLNSMHSLAITYNGKEQWQEAESLLVEVLEKKKKAPGLEHRITLMIMMELALTWKGSGRIDEAIELMEECSQTQTRVLGREHADTQISLSRLQEWRAEKLQARERRLKPMLGNAMTSMTTKFRKLSPARWGHDNGARPSS
ncbi:P-loop containing nucleoside triphosphate hydrolase protein [Xylaria cf. heliscus]|nr:P-loop containing nucleoside triphosphate hydrolase protein [Xylaria cf. heliscus]